MYSFVLNSSWTPFLNCFLILHLLYIFSKIQQSFVASSRLFRITSSTRSNKSLNFVINRKHFYDSIVILFESHDTRKPSASLPELCHSSKRKWNITYTTTNMCMRKFSRTHLVPLKKSKVQAVFFHSCCNRKYIQIENNILWRKTNFVYQNIIRTLEISRTFVIISLTHFIKSHDNCSSTVAWSI
jgi:hypothetical protein